MIDVEREYKALKNKLNKYKTKKLGFEYGMSCGYVTQVNLVEDPFSKYPWKKAIEVRGLAGFDAHERVLMYITENMSKGKDYKYWKEYHILECFELREF